MAIWKRSLSGWGILAVRRCLPLGLAGGFLLCPAPGWGQQRLLLPIEFTPTVTLQEEYNDNFFLTDKNRKSDWRTTLSPGVSLRLTTGRSQADLSYLLSLAHSTAIGDELQIFHSLGGAGTLSLTERLSLHLSERFSRTDEPAVTDALGIFRDRRTVTTNSASAGLTHAGDRHWLGLTYADTRSGQSGADAEQSRIHAVRPELAYTLDPVTSLDLRYEYTQAEFRIGRDFRGHEGNFEIKRELTRTTRAGLTGRLIVREPEEGRQFNIVRGGVTFTTELTPTLTWESETGYERATAGEGTDGFSGLIRLTHQGPTVRLSLSVGQALEETFQERENVGLVRTRSAAIEATYTPTDRLTLAGSGSLALTTFEQSEAAATLLRTGAIQAGREREDTLIRLELAATLKLSRVFSLAARYRFGQRDSNVPEFDYTNNVVTLGLTATY